MHRTKHFLTIMTLTLLLISSITWAQQNQERLSAPRASRPAESDPAEQTDLQANETTNPLYLPIIFQSVVVRGDTVDISNKASVIAFYNAQYLTSETSDADMGWTGNVGGCNAGTTSADFRAKVLQRINFFRAMAGVPTTVTFTDALNEKAQAAALMMSAEGDLSHSPGASWACYTVSGASGAGQSNLYLGRNGATAITGYMQDPGSANGAVGHRRWIIYPQTLEMGTGDIPAGTGSQANALAVFGGAASSTRTARDTFVAWPPPGYVPYNLVFARWSLSYNFVDFSAATVTMTIDGVPQSLIIENRDNGSGFSFGEDSIVWRIDSMSDGADWPNPNGESTVHIKIENAKVSGSAQTFEYDVIIFTP